jgi:signal transduction histidine kinase
MLIMPKNSLLNTIKRIRQLFKHKSIDLDELIENNARMKEILERRSVLEEIGALSASIEHDIKTPLATMRLVIRNMETKFQHNSDIMIHLAKLETHRSRIAAIIRTISISRADADFYERYMLKTNLREVIHRCIKTVKDEVNTKNIFFSQDVQFIHFVYAYPSLLQHAIANVLKNAIEAIYEAKRERGIIHIMSKLDSESNNLLTIEVRDNGCGIPDEDINRLTSLFATKAGIRPNSGFGLFIANKIMEIHKGRLEIKSKIGEGSVVSLTLPRC